MDIAETRKAVDDIRRAATDWDMPNFQATKLQLRLASDFARFVSKKTGATHEYLSTLAAVVLEGLTLEAEQQEHFEFSGVQDNPDSPRPMGGGVLPS